MPDFLHPRLLVSSLLTGLLSASFSGLRFGILLLATPAFASPPQLVLDIDPRTYAPDSAPRDFVEVGAQTFFTANQGAPAYGPSADGPGRELWVTDGTAEGTRLVRDLAALPKHLGPDHLTPVGSERIFFVSQTHTLGREPWVSDGTGEGTVLLGDFCPGRCGSSVEGVLRFGSRVLFSTGASVGGIGTTRQWVTDGTPEGTEPFFLGGDAEAVVVEGDGFGSHRFLIATRTAAGGTGGAPAGWLRELWISDGSAEGSASLAAAFPDLGVEGEGRIYGLQLVGSEAVFVVETGDGQRTLWFSDGTVAGTEPLKALPSLPIEASLVPKRRIPWAHMVDGPVFLLLTEPTPDRYECELWVTDGTSAGTSRLVGLGQAAGLDPDVLRWDHCPAELYSVPAPPITPPSPDHAFFSFSDYSTFSQLWVTDGTALGTAPLHDFGHTGFLSFGSSFTTWQSQLFFYDHDEEGAGIFTSTGSSSGASKVIPLGFGSKTYLPENAIGKVGFPLIFQGSDYINGPQPWTSLGTNDSSQLLAVLDFGAVSAFPRQLLSAPAASGDDIVFLAYHPGPFGDGQNPEGASRNGLWASDGSAAGTRLLVDGGVEYYDGVIEAPVLTPAGLFLRRADTVNGDTLLFSSDLVNFETVASFPVIEEIVAFGDGVCFTAEDPDLGLEPWCSDGTVEGLVSLGDLAPGRADPPFAGSDTDVPVSSRPSAFTVAGDHLYFRTVSHLDTNEGVLLPTALWRTDGSAIGTRKVFSSAGAGQQGPELPGISLGSGDGPLMAYGDDLYFLTEDLHPVLWRLRGGVVPEPMGRMGGPGDLIRVKAWAEFRGRLVFLLSDGLDGGSLWSTDGGPIPSDEGARRLATFQRIYGSSQEFVPQLVAVGNDLYFAADGGDGAGLELWSTDATAAGTRRVSDLAPGAADAYPRHLAAVGSRLVFSATDGPHGFELWVSDGTAEGTALLADLEPGPTGSEPREPLLRGDTLYFSAWTSATGRELHRLAVPDLLSRSCVEDNQRFCLRDGRFEVLVDWVDPRSLDAGRGTGTPYLGANGSDDTGQVWFFRDDNRELAVKILDGRPVNDHHWLFYGALTDVAYWLSGVDLETGVARTWASPAREICAAAADRAFPEDPATGIGPTIPSFALRIPAAGEGQLASAPVSVGPPCDDPQELCLQDGRFRLRVDWRDQRRPGRVGKGTRIPDTERSGAFWFFREGNLELLVKVLDARTVDGHFWIFYGNLTDVEFDLHVTDVVTSRTKTYTNPGGSLCGDADTTYF